MKKIKKILRKIKHILERKLKFYRRLGLKNKTPSIISNNCTGGYVYQFLGIEYYSPTAGLFFTGEDYVKLCKNVKHYFSSRLDFIDHNKSKNRDLLVHSNRWGEYPVAKLDDIEVYFMHYHSREEAATKWYRRISRVNYDNIFFLFTESEISKEDDIKQFCQLPTVNKVCLTYKSNYKNTVFCQQVADMEQPSWLPKIVLNSVSWKNLLNDMEKNDGR